MSTKKQHLYSDNYILVHTSPCNTNKYNDYCACSNKTNPSTNHSSYLQGYLRNISATQSPTKFHSTNPKKCDCTNCNTATTNNLWLQDMKTSCLQYEMSNTVTATCSAADKISCVTLKHILESFKAPLSEEQAWAIIYQYINMFRQLFEAKRYECIFNNFEIPETLNDMFLHLDGTVHCPLEKIKNNVRNIRENRQQQQKKNNVCNRLELITTSHKKILRNIGTIVYTALDYNLHDDEQCHISKELEDLITYMTTNVVEDGCIDEGIDEGYKRWDDEFETNPKTNETKEFDTVLNICLNHIKPAIPEVHYKAVCRALVTETVELGIFLQQILINKNNDFNVNNDFNASQQELAKLGFHDWARFWIQVIDELRKGVRLKKANYVRTPIEYELTPYEILMEDIRSKKYQLRKVMINGNIPPLVKKDAHALILEFIRSRPPLKKMSERKLAPPIKRTLSPRELLMDSIRKGHKLKHVEAPTLTRRLNNTLFLSMPETKSSINLTLTERLRLKNDRELFNDENDGYRETCRSKQRLIKINSSLLQEDDVFSAHSNLTSTVNLNVSTKEYCKIKTMASKSICTQPKMPPYPLDAYMIHDPMASKPIGTTTNDQINSLKSDVTHGRRGEDNRRSSVRRHSIVGCQNNLKETAPTFISRPQSQQSNSSSIIDNEYSGQRKKQQQEKPHQTESSLPKEDNCRSLGVPWSKSFMDEKTWNEVADDRLSLTLEEIVHIRSVMTKAELESLPVGVRVKEDVERRKVCFLCLRTRFSLFGPWGVECKICRRTVCSKCHTKMRIPAEHFRNVPLVLISPSLLSTPAGSSSPSPSHYAGYIHSSSTGNILDESFSKKLIERLIRSEITEPKSCIGTLNTPPPSPKYQRSNMSTPGIKSNELHAIGPGQTFAAVQDKVPLPLTLLTDTTHSSIENFMTKRAHNANAKQETNFCKNFHIISRSVEGSYSLPMQSPASRSHSNNSTLDRKSKFPQKLTLSSSSCPLAHDQKENVHGEQVSVCNDCHGLVMEISKSAKHKRSSARNKTLKTLTLDLRPVWK